MLTGLKGLRQFPLEMKFLYGRYRLPDRFDGFEGVSARNEILIWGRRISKI